MSSAGERSASMSSSSTEYLVPPAIRYVLPMLADVISDD